MATFLAKPEGGGFTFYIILAYNCKTFKYIEALNMICNHKPWDYGGIEPLEIYIKYKCRTIYYISLMHIFSSYDKVFIILLIKYIH